MRVWKLASDLVLIVLALIWVMIIGEGMLGQFFSQFK